MIGNKFGHWVVIDTAPCPIKDVNKNGISYKYFLCRCDCENKTEKVIRYVNLKYGRTTSCGCEKKKVKIQKITNKYIGKKFNRLTPISIEKVDKQKIYFLCQCECGKQTIVEKKNLKYGLVKSCGCLKRELMTNFNKTNKKLYNNYKFYDNFIVG